MTMTVTLVSGPPCGGKTTYVRANARPEDEVIDYDVFVEQLSGDRYSNDPDVRAQALDLWKRAVDSPPTRNRWVIWASPSRKQRAIFRRTHGATVVLVIADHEVCRARAESERPGHWVDAVDHWFATWEPSTSSPEMIVRTDRQGLVL